MQVFNCKLVGKKYSGSSYDGNASPCLINPGSTEEHIIADWMETGFGFRHTTWMVNEHCLSHNQIMSKQNAVMGAFRHMLPVITKLQKRIQGNVNHDAWKLARKSQTKQYMVMLGKITRQDLLNEYGDSPIPMWLNPAHLPSICGSQIGWWDEMYIK